MGIHVDIPQRKLSGMAAPLHAVAEKGKRRSRGRRKDGWSSGVGTIVLKINSKQTEVGVLLFILFRRMIHVMKGTGLTITGREASACCASANDVSSPAVQREATGAEESVECWKVAAPSGED